MFSQWRFIIVGLLFVVTTWPARSGPAPEELGAKTYMVKMRDGVKLATDVYLPHDRKPAPVLLMRTPYSRRWPAVNQHLDGYAVVIQDMRGRFDSEGANIPFDADGQDGYDTLEWIATQPWCNGRIGMYAGSAMGIAQILAACSGTERLTCQQISFALPNLYEIAFVNGLFRQSIVEGWLSDNQFDPEVPKVWASHPTYDQYWHRRDATHRFHKVNVPATHSNGWYDLFAQGTIDAFVGFQTRGREKARGKQKLVMGVYPHTEDEQAREIEFPHADEAPRIPWIEHYLQGDDGGKAQKAPAVAYFVMGDATDPSAPGNCWRTADAWPPLKTKQTPIYLHGDMTLGMEKNLQAGSLAYHYDPKNPVPTIGGPQYYLPAGPRDQRKIESRSDVLVFTTAPLEKPLEVTGRVTARLWASTDAPDTDFFVRLCDVYPDGRSIIICEGGRRARLRDSLSAEKPVAAGKVYLFEIDMWSTSIIFNKGHKLRIHVTSSCAPGYIPNSNTGRYPYSGTTRMAHNTVYMDRKHPSCVLLPVPERRSRPEWTAHVR